MKNIENEKQKEEEKKKKKVLYKSECDIQNLGPTDCEVSIKLQNFIIKLENKDDLNKNYEIIFDNRESIENIQKNYKKYDEMINDFEYDQENDTIKLKNENEELKFKVNKLPPRKEKKKAKKEEEEKEEVFLDEEEKEENMEGKDKDFGNEEDMEKHL